MICWRDGDRVRLFTRRGHDWTDRVPAIAEAQDVLLQSHKAPRIRFAA